MLGVLEMGQSTLWKIRYQISNESSATRKCLQEISSQQSTTATTSHAHETPTMVICSEEQERSTISHCLHPVQSSSLSQKNFPEIRYFEWISKYYLGQFQDLQGYTEKHAGANRCGSSAAKALYSGDYWLARAGVDPLLRPYHTFKDEFSVADGIVHKGQVAVIPSSMRLAMLEKIHTFWIMLLFSKSQGFPSMASHSLRYQGCSVCQSGPKRSHAQP